MKRVFAKDGRTMKRPLLIRARTQKHWTLARAAEELQVDINTISRWEHGLSRPFAYNLERLCQVYGATAADLGLEEEWEATDSTSPMTPSKEQQEQHTDLVTLAGQQIRRCAC